MKQQLGEWGEAEHEAKIEYGNCMKDQELFEKTFANIPIPERQNPIYVSYQYGPMSWNVVWLEVNAGTEVGFAALKFLKEEKII